jgi:ankyrin repeat protein
MVNFFGHVVITEQLIEDHGNLDLQHDNGTTPLTISDNRGHAAVANVLLAV